jgi:Aspartyl protease
MGRMRPACVAPLPRGRIAAAMLACAVPAAVVVAGAAPGGIIPAASPPGVPFESPLGMVVVTVRLEDRIEARLLLDTGDPGGLTLDPELARAAGARPLPGETRSLTGLLGEETRELQRVRLRGVRLGNWELPEPEVWTTTGVREFGRAIGVELDGFLGVAALRPFRVTIDYPRRRLLLQRSPAAPSGGADDGGAILRLLDGRLLVETRLHDRLPRLMLLDTASAATFIAKEDAGPTRPDPQGPARFADAGARVTLLPRRLLPSLRIGAARLRDLPVVPYDFDRLRAAGLAGASPPVSGIIGADALAGHVLVLDPAAGILLLRPGGSEAPPGGG